MVRRSNSKQADWEKELADEATTESAREKSSGGGGLGNRLSIKGRRFTLGDESLGRELKCVILDFVYVNTFYSDAYNEEEANIPSCFAISADGEDMVPHDNVREPENDACEGCPNNEWGSAARGRGKACKNRRRLAVIHVDDLEDVENAEIAFLEIPTTSIKHWSKYVKDVKDKAARPYYTVVTTLAFDEDEDYPVVTFEMDEKVSEREVVEAIKAKREEVRDELLTPFEIPEESEKPKGKSKPAAKATKSKRREEPEEDEDEAEAEAEEEEDEKPVRRRATKPTKEEPPVKRRGSRFGR